MNTTVKLENARTNVDAENAKPGDYFHHKDSSVYLLATVRGSYILNNVETGQRYTDNADGTLLGAFGGDAADFKLVRAVNIIIHP